MKEIVGDIHDEYDTEEEEDLTEIIPHQEYVALGSARLDDLNETLHLDIESEDYDSIGGYIIEQLDRFPEQGESLTTESGIRLVVDKAERNRIESVSYLSSAQKEQVSESEQQFKKGLTL